MTEFDRSVTDEQLTAYLDDALPSDTRKLVEDALANDPKVQHRLEHLHVPLGLLKQAYDPAAMGAPSMPADLRKKMNVVPTPEAANSNKAPRYFWPASLAASFALGMLLITAMRPAGHGIEQMTWVDTVASYQALYVTETIAGPRQAPDVTERVLARAQSIMGVDLQAALDIEGLTFKRIQMLALDGEPLIQMAYLDQQGRPFAFCLTRQTTGDLDQETRMSFDLAASSWVKDGVGFVLVGGQNGLETEEIAAKFQSVI